MTLRQAALVAGVGYLLMPVAFAEFYVFPKLVVAGDIEQTAQNIQAHGGLFLAAIFCYLISFISDVVIAWALYILLAPVNRSLSLLAAWFRLMYTAMALFALLNLVVAHRLLTTADYLPLFGVGPRNAQLRLLLDSFRYDWSLSLIVFAIHLALIGWLIYRSGYVPRTIGILLVINGLGWLVDSLRPYFFPSAHLGFVAVTFFGELVFMIWLLVRGWKVPQPAAAVGPRA